MYLIPIQDFCHKNMHLIKKTEFVDRNVFKLQRFSKVFPNVGGSALLWRGHLSKNLLKPRIRLQVSFSLVVWHINK